MTKDTDKKEPPQRDDARANAEERCETMIHGKTKLRTAACE